MQTGFVSLIGAGPGDPELMTVKGLRRLREADVVIYDALIDPALLYECRTDAERIDVGKRAGRHTCRQEEINGLLIAQAQRGKHVVRLKGGDPFVFGRGAEEALALEQAGIAWEVVPGVSAAIAAPACAGIPVTHRQLAASFAVVTGHTATSDKPDRLNWQALATGVDTLVVLMGVSRLAEIANRLIDAGRAPTTPAAVVRWASTPWQESVVATLETIVAEVERAGLQAPATLIVGDVVTLSEQLAPVAELLALAD